MRAINLDWKSIVSRSKKLTRWLLQMYELEPLFRQCEYCGIEANNSLNKAVVLHATD